MQSALLIVNPVSGRGRGRKIAPQLAELLGQRGIRTEIFYTEKPGDAKAKTAAVNGSVELIIAAGGDGTLNEVLNGLPRPIPLALFPLGTANVLALELSLPRAASEFAELIGKGKQTEIDLVRANGRLGFFSIGVGIDGMVIERLHQKRHGAIRKSSYIPLLWHCIRHYRTPELSVTLDGENFRGVSFALIANTRHYGGKFFELSPDRRLDDGLYECYLFRGRGRRALLKYLLRGLAHRLLSKGDPLVRRAKKIRIESTVPGRELPYQIDGEFGGQTPVEMEVIPKGMRIFQK